MKAVTDTALFLLCVYKKVILFITYIIYPHRAFLKD